MLTLNNSELQNLTKSLESATTLMNDLLDDIQDNATSLAVLKVKLESLSVSVEALSDIVRDGNGKGSMVTRLALAEHSLSQIEESVNAFKDEMQIAVKEIRAELANEIKEEKAEVAKFKRDKLLAKLKVIAIVAPGAIALAAMIIKILMGVE